MNERLGESEFVAGSDYSVADITAFVAVEFAGWIKLAPSDGAAHLHRWLAAMRARPSATV